MRFLLSVAFACVVLAAAVRNAEAQAANEAVITVNDFAVHLGVSVSSLGYRQKQPFTQLAVALVYKPAGQSEKKSKTLVSANYSFSAARTEVPIRILFDARSSTLVVEHSTVQGRGIKLRRPFVLMNPPGTLAEGRYVIATETVPTRAPSVLQLVVTTKEY